MKREELGTVNNENKKVRLHVLKIERDFYNDILLGDKTWELRLNDRDYHVGDLIHFTEIDGCEFADLSRWQDDLLLFNLFKIKYVFTNYKYGLKKGYCILTIEKAIRG